MSRDGDRKYPRAIESRNSYLRIRAPEHLDVALEGLIRKVLREQPRMDDIYKFAADYFDMLLKIREKAGMRKLSAQDICPTHNDEDAHEMIKLASTFAKKKMKESKTGTKTYKPLSLRRDSMKGIEMRNAINEDFGRLADGLPLTTAIPNVTMTTVSHHENQISNEANDAAKEEKTEVAPPEFDITKRLSSQPPSEVIVEAMEVPHTEDDNGNGDSNNDGNGDEEEGERNAEEGEPSAKEILDSVGDIDEIRDKIKEVEKEIKLLERRDSKEGEEECGEQKKKDTEVEKADEPQSEEIVLAKRVGLLGEEIEKDETYIEQEEQTEVAQDGTPDDLEEKISKEADTSQNIEDEEKKECEPKEENNEDNTEAVIIEAKEKEEGNDEQGTEDKAETRTETTALEAESGVVNEVSETAEEKANEPEKKTEMEATPENVAVMNEEKNVNEEKEDTKEATETKVEPEPAGVESAEAPEDKPDEKGTEDEAQANEVTEMKSNDEAEDGTEHTAEVMEEKTETEEAGEETVAEDQQEDTYDQSGEAKSAEEKEEKEEEKSVSEGKSKTAEEQSGQADAGTLDQSVEQVSTEITPEEGSEETVEANPSDDQSEAEKNEIEGEEKKAENTPGVTNEEKIESEKTGAEEQQKDGTYGNSLADVTNVKKSVDGCKENEESKEDSVAEEKTDDGVKEGEEIKEDTVAEEKTDDGVKESEEIKEDTVVEEKADDGLKESEDTKEDIVAEEKTNDESKENREAGEGRVVIGVEEETESGTEGEEIKEEAVIEEAKEKEEENVVADESEEKLDDESKESEEPKEETPAEVGMEKAEEQMKETVETKDDVDESRENEEADQNGTSETGEENIEQAGDDGEDKVTTEKVAENDEEKRYDDSAEQVGQEDKTEVTEPENTVSVEDSQDGEVATEEKVGESGEEKQDNMNEANESGETSTEQADPAVNENGKVEDRDGEEVEVPASGEEQPPEEAVEREKDDAEAKEIQLMGGTELKDEKVENEELITKEKEVKTEGDASHTTMASESDGKDGEGDETRLAEVGLVAAGVAGGVIAAARAALGDSQTDESVATTNEAPLAVEDVLMSVEVMAPPTEDVKKFLESEREHSGYDKGVLYDEVVSDAVVVVASEAETKLHDDGNVEADDDQERGSTTSGEFEFEVSPIKDSEPQIILEVSASSNMVVGEDATTVDDSKEFLMVPEPILDEYRADEVTSRRRRSVSDDAIAIPECGNIGNEVRQGRSDVERVELVEGDEDILQVHLTTTVEAETESSGDSILIEMTSRVEPPNQVEVSVEASESMTLVRAAVIIQNGFRRFKKRQTVPGESSESDVDVTERSRPNPFKSISPPDTESSLSLSTAKDVRRRNLGRSATRTLLETQSLDPIRKITPLKTRSLSSVRYGVADFEVWNQLVQELEEAATKIQSNYRGYKTRKRLRRENAVQSTLTTSGESGVLDVNEMSTGEFHDSIVLPIHPK